MACDICGETGKYLYDMSEEYKTIDIQQICDNCRSDVNDQLFKIRALNRKITKTWLEKFMYALRIKKNKKRRNKQ